MAELIETWSVKPEEEDLMGDEHAWIWREMIRAAELPDLSKAKVLDVGCNQGGFLRMLYDANPFASGAGVDLARHAIEIASTNAGDRPLNYKATTQLSEAGRGFDFAFSHEVIYLIADLADHAAQMAKVLKPGGTYFAVTCCHRDSPLWAKWRPKIQGFSNITVPDHGVDEIAAPFRDAGFDVSVSRFLADAFVPLLGPTDYFPSDRARLETYADWKLMFRFRRLASVVSGL